MTRSYLNLGMLVHICSPSTQEAKTGGSVWDRGQLGSLWIQDQPGLKWSQTNKKHPATTEHKQNTKREMERGKEERNVCPVRSVLTMTLWYTYSFPGALQSLSHLKVIDNSRILNIECLGYLFVLPGAQDTRLVLQVAFFSLSCSVVQLVMLFC